MSGHSKWSTIKIEPRSGSTINSIVEFTIWNLSLPLISLWFPFAGLVAFLDRAIFRWFLMGDILFYRQISVKWLKWNKRIYFLKYMINVARLMRYVNISPHVVFVYQTFLFLFGRKSKYCSTRNLDWSPKTSKFILLQCH